ncbi:hypothetical protein SAY87_024614 [Trapa incisa]|uniref:Glycine-rich protein n=1 Tax=Trapa incisa TaxID=236973 RepID=A0AAN7G9W9_9MYRT|nr:hypothetical protein SAY87_024614 [Trapa incisa]
MALPPNSKLFLATIALFTMISLMLLLSLSSAAVAVAEPYNHLGRRLLGVVVKVDDYYGGGGGYPTGGGGYSYPSPP